MSKFTEYLEATSAIKKPKPKLNICENCKWYLQEDEGYSDYTVTDVNYWCMKHKKQLFELNFKPEEPKECNKFQKGKSTTINVDWNDNDSKSLKIDNPIIYKIAKELDIIN